MSAIELSAEAAVADAQCGRVAEEYRRVRSFSEEICAPLTPEDCVIQSMPDVSPTRWHLAHTAWFFETFFLRRQDGYRPFNDDFEYLFNSYYNTVGEQFPRSRRGLLSRPTVDEVLEYRLHVDHETLKHLDAGDVSPAEMPVLEVGLNHEQQHQELMLTDIKHVLSCSPLFPHYASAPLAECAPRGESRFVDFEGGLYEIGHGGPRFAFDNESPRHQVFLRPFRLATRAVTAGEYLEFIEDGGYRRPQWWLSLGWQTVCEQSWNAPLYWHQRDGEWFQFTLSGLQRVDRDAPVCHISYFEADAFARWTGARLPTEAEWEVAAAELPVRGNFADDLIASGVCVHPQGIALQTAAGASGPPALLQMFGDTWEWTSSPYTAYPGYAPPPGALGEYNGKFMCGQYVLRGGSCATPSGHVRRSYRNFFPPDARWQFSGLRLARDA